jgi:hypothetical protein
MIIERDKFGSALADDPTNMRVKQRTAFQPDHLRRILAPPYNGLGRWSAEQLNRWRGLTAAGSSPFPERRQGGAAVQFGDTGAAERNANVGDWLTGRLGRQNFRRLCLASPSHYSSYMKLHFVDDTPPTGELTIAKNLRVAWTVGGMGIIALDLLKSDRRGDGRRERRLERRDRHRRVRRAMARGSSAARVRPKIMLAVLPTHVLIPA